jgi:hypothetical protein
VHHTIVPFADNITDSLEDETRGDGSLCGADSLKEDSCRAPKERIVWGSLRSALEEQGAGEGKRALSSKNSANRTDNQSFLNSVTYGSRVQRYQNGS